MSKELERLKEMIKVMEKNITNHYVKKAKQADKITCSQTAMRQLNYLENEELKAQVTIGEFLDLAEKFL